MLLRNFLLLMGGHLFAFYAGFCLLGGPDGAVLSRASLLFGLPSLAIAGLLTYACNKFVPLGGYAFVPLLVVIIAWVMAVAGFNRAGFNIWLFGTVAASVAVVVYWVIVQLSLRQA